MNTFDLDVIELALLAGVEGSRSLDAPIRGFARKVSKKSVPISRGNASGKKRSVQVAKYVLDGVQGAVLIRYPDAYAKVGAPKTFERYFIPFSAFGSVRAMLEQTIRID